MGVSEKEPLSSHCEWEHALDWKQQWHLSISSLYRMAIKCKQYKMTLHDITIAGIS